MFHPFHPASILMPLAFFWMFVCFVVCYVFLFVFVFLCFGVQGCVRLLILI